MPSDKAIDYSPGVSPVSYLHSLPYLLFKAGLPRFQQREEALVASGASHRVFMTNPLFNPFKRELTKSRFTPDLTGERTWDHETQQTPGKSEIKLV